ncbi:MAG: DUF1697 domain-containing protein [Gemmatimonadaceae bacterium]
MPRYIAFLRAVNVGGRVVKMAQLKSIFESIALTNVETFIASGNVIFSNKSKSVPSLVRNIEDALQAELNYDVPVFLRSDSELYAIAERRHAVFSESEVSGAHSLNVGMLHAPLTPDTEKAMLSFNSDTETFRTHEREIYMLLHSPVTTSKFSIKRFEKAIGAETTFRNMNTMQRLAKKYPATNT